MPTRTALARKLNTSVRKHKRTHERRKTLPAAPERPAIAAQAGVSAIGYPISA